MAQGGEPPERDVKDFEFRQLVKCRLYPTPSSPLPVKRLQQLAVSSKFDLIFAASNNEMKILRLGSVCQQDDRIEARERNTAIVDIPCDRQINVGALIVHLAVSSDDLTLSVVVDDDKTLTLLLFDLPAIAGQAAAPAPFAQFLLSSVGGASLLDLAWNPAFPTLLAVCVTDGNVTLLEVTNAVAPKASISLPASCLSWSPKGKQIMVGKADGSCTQYDHEMKPKKEWSAPAIFTEPHQVTDMVWISTYTYLASYLRHSADATVQPIVVMTVSNKEGNTSYINYDDICFGSGEEQKAKYFFQYLLQWELIVTSSCSATESTVIAKHLDDKAQWEHWTLEDASRAELPVTAEQVDSYPMGMAVIFSSQHTLQLDDSKRHPPCPVLLLLSTDGLLVSFHMAYFHAQAPVLTMPPQPLPLQSARPTATAAPAVVGSMAAAAAPPSAPSLLPSSALPPSAVSQPPAPSLAGLLTSPPMSAAAATLPQSAAATTNSLGAGFGQMAPVRSLFGQPAASASLGGLLGQTASTTAPSFSFAPAEGAVSAVSGAPATVKPTFSFGLPKSDASAAPLPLQPGGGSGGKNLFGAFNAAAAAAQSGSGGGVAPAGMKPLSLGATANSGAGDMVAKPFSLGTQQPPPPATATAAAAPKPAADKPSLLGSGPLGGGGGGAMSGALGAGGGGSGQFSFSFKPPPPLAAAGSSTSSSAAATTTAAASSTSSFPPPLAASSALGGPPLSAGFMPQGQSSAPSFMPAPPPVATSAVSAPTVAPAALAVASVTPAASFPAPVASVAAFSTTPVAPAAPAASLSILATAAAGVSGAAAESSGVADGAVPKAATTSVPAGGDREIDAILNSTISQNITEEIEDFERELRDLRQRMSRPGPLIGTKEEMQTLCQNAMKMEAFSKEITAMTKENCREMYDLKGSCLDLFAMAEECRCRQERNHDPQYLRALQQRALDPATATRMRRLRQSAQQIAQALSDADAVLDSQWEAQREKEKKMRIYIPNSDTLYRAIKSNHNVLMSRQHALERVQDQLRRLQVKSRAPTGENLSFNRAAGGAAAGSWAGGATPPRDWRLKKADLLTPEKISLLKESLASHRVRKVKCQPLATLAQSRLVSVRNQYRSCSIVSTDSSVHGTGATVKETESSSAVASNGSETRTTFLTSTPTAPAQAPAPAPVREAAKPPPAPTSFSGVAYFKPKSVVTPEGAVLGGGAVTAPPPLQVSLSAAGGVLGTGAAFKNPSLAGQPAPAPSSFPAFSAQPPPSFGGAAVAPAPAVAPSMQPRYENVSPTDFDDDTGDDEYDEYAGYEEDEEDEDEEEEEEEGAFGDQYEYPSETFSGGPSTPASGFPSLLARPAGSGISKNLFNIPSSEAADRSATPTALDMSSGAQAGGGGGGISFGAPLSASSVAGKPDFSLAALSGQDEGKKDEADGVPPALHLVVVWLQRPVQEACLAPNLRRQTQQQRPHHSRRHKPVGGLFGFSTAPSTTAATSASGSGLFGAPPKFGSPSLFGGQMGSSAVSAPSSPPVGFFAAAATGTAASSTSGTPTPGFSFSPTTTTSSAAQATSAASSSTSTTTTTTGGSVFGGASSVFGGGGGVPSFSSLLKTEASSTTTSENAVTSSQGSPFTKPASGFGSVAAGGSLFGASASASSGAGSVFGAASTTGSLFGKPATTNANTPPTPSLFTSPNATTTTTVPLLPTPTTMTATTTTPAVAPATTAPDVTASASSAAGLISADVATTTATTAEAVVASSGAFGSGGAPPLFGSASGGGLTPAGGSGGMNLFGSTSSTGIVFGAPSTNTAAATSVSGSSGGGGLFAAPPATSSTTPLFGGLGASATTTTTASSPFGAAATSSSAGAGGLLATPTSAVAATGSSLFGSAGGQGSIFGTAAAATTATGSVFGGASATAAPVTTVSTFGFGSTSSAATTTGSTFGFGQPAAAATTGSSFGFGQPPPSSSSATVAATTASTGSTFGFGQASGFGGFGKPAFGSTSVFGQSPGFGQSSPSGFGQTATSTGFGSSPGFGQPATTAAESSSLGGSFFGGGAGGGVFGLGAKPSEEKAKQNVFGSSQVFGSGSANNSLFGNKGATVFGSSPTASGGGGGGSVFGGGGAGGSSGGGAGVGGGVGGFSNATSGTGGVASLGFAVTQTPASSSGGFGGAPSFGGSPAFGGTPAFGSSPAFGGSPGFGSSAAFPAGPFGASQQTATSGGGFSSFASSSTAPTFGSLAQSPDAPTFGSMGQGGGGGGFGALAAQGGGGGGGGFGAQSPGFGAGSPGFGGAPQQQQQQQPQPPAFGNAGFGASPSFSSYRG
ncbi:uncharacterized protein LOC143276071 [Babylonia areolata]|uniref:uncharacterized protein LOC143276071 n=1 Tax=Babylonia areolata TaxID=304850 RepID=UPI003FD13F38